MWPPADQPQHFYPLHVCSLGQVPLSYSSLYGKSVHESMVMKTSHPWWQWWLVVGLGCWLFLGIFVANSNAGTFLLKNQNNLQNQTTDSVPKCNTQFGVFPLLYCARVFNMAVLSCWLLVASPPPNLQNHFLSRRCESVFCLGSSTLRSWGQWGERERSWTGERQWERGPGENKISFGHGTWFFIPHRYTFKILRHGTCQSKAKLAS